MLVAPVETDKRRPQEDRDEVSALPQGFAFTSRIMLDGNLLYGGVIDNPFMSFGSGFRVALFAALDGRGTP